MRECLVEKRLGICKRELLDLAQELVPGDGVERGAQAGFIFFSEGDGVSVESGKQLLELSSDVARASNGDGRRCRCCGGSAGQGGSELCQERIKNVGKLLQSGIRGICRGLVAQ